jgi:hypothetical protein
MDDNAQPMTREQADRLISLIEKQVIRPQIDLRRRAGDVSEVLTWLANALGLIGAALAVLQLFLFGRTGILPGLLNLAVVVLATGTIWGLLTAASVVAAFVANRSDR